MPITYKPWPPSQKQMLQTKTNTPPLLLTLMTSILSSKTKPGQNKQQCVSSICQDIIYSVTNSRHRTTEHVLLSLCTKRKTGSKEILKWLNRFGNCISYDEVTYLETFLATEEMKYQAIKSFYPSSVQPSIFVTFIWDNNDINPCIALIELSFSCHQIIR